MTFMDILKSLFDVALVCFAVWAVLHEDKFIRFEEALVCRFRRRKLKAVKGNAANVRCRNN